MILEERTSGTDRKKTTVLTDMVLSNFETIARLGDATAPLSNMLSHIKPLRHVGEKMMNISGERQLPEFQRNTFAKWFRSRKRMQ